MAIRHLDDGGSGRRGEPLMTQTDAQDRHLHAHRLRDPLELDRVGEACRIAGTVCQDKAVSLIKVRVPRAVPGYPDDRGPTIEQTSNDVFLCPGVDEQYAQPS